MTIETSTCTRAQHILNRRSATLKWTTFYRGLKTHGYHHLPLRGTECHIPDKSRHWNVFGGICLYKTPEDSLDLALKREIQDLREDEFSPEAMTEFLRDMIANLNGIYYVVSMDPELLQQPKVRE